MIGALDGPASLGQDALAPLRDGKSSSSIAEAVSLFVSAQRPWEATPVPVVADFTLRPHFVATR